uniref:Uncharacterized protein n=1 Tax=Cacopsylla melanoneura TaxID=428564 RepID=A0A8D8VR72_9HEMI
MYSGQEHVEVLFSLACGIVSTVGKPSSAWLIRCVCSVRFVLELSFLRCPCLCRLVLFVGGLDVFLNLQVRVLQSLLHQRKMSMTPSLVRVIPHQRKVFLGVQMSHFMKTHKSVFLV